EQLRGEAADARSDLFSFCISLYEALYGERPFPGDTVSTLRESIERGLLRKPPARARVPKWLRRALLRGLHPDPAARPARVGGVRRVGDTAPVGPGAGAVAGGGVGRAAAAPGGGPARRAAPACLGAEQQLAGIGDEPMRQATRASFFATGAPFAADA